MKTEKLFAMFVLLIFIIGGMFFTMFWIMGRGGPTPQTFVCADGSVVTNAASCPTTDGETVTDGGCYGGLYVDVTAGGKETITGTAIAVNAETFTAAGTEVAGETSVASAITTVANDVFPVKSSGYVLIGNDNFQSSTDRGTEYYYYKKPFTVGCAPAILGFINLYAEGTPTFTCYDDGTAETTCNITVGTAVVDTTEIKITTSANAYLGMPMAGDNMPINYPLGVCVNVTTEADWDKIYPSPYASGYSDPGMGITNGRFDAPEFLSGNNTLDDCYVLDTRALRDPAGNGYARYYKFWLLFDPDGSGVTEADTTYLILMDICWSKNDQIQWRLGFGDDSEQGTDSDCGMDSAGNVLAIYHT